MDSNNGALSQGTEPAIDTSDWRSLLLPNSRQKIVDLLMITLMKNVPVSDPEELPELQTNIQRFENMTFTVAKDRSDYLRKISVMVHTVKAQSQHTIVNKMLSVELGPSNEPLDQVNLNSTDSSMDTSDWRAQLLPVSRQTFVNKLVDQLVKLDPDPDALGFPLLQKIAQRFEERIFAVAISQSDYLWKLSLKTVFLLTLLIYGVYI